MLLKSRKAYIIGGAILLVLIVAAGIGFFLIVPALVVHNAPAPDATPVPTRRVNPYTQPLKQYGLDIKNQIAQGLHLTADQLTAQEKAGKTLSDIATAQGVAPTQLNIIVANAFQMALKPAVDAGDLTQKQVDTLVKRMQSNTVMLNRFLGAPAKAVAQGQ